MVGPKHVGTTAAKGGNSIQAQPRGLPITHIPLSMRTICN